MNSFVNYMLWFIFGGSTYCAIELLYRQRTHYSMFFCSGLAVIILLYIFQNNKDIKPVTFGIIASGIITALELIFGIIFNLVLKQNVWDYSNTPLNILGQICLPFSLIWFFFGLIIYFIFRFIPVLKI